VRAPLGHDEVIKPESHVRVLTIADRACKGDPGAQERERRSRFFLLVVVVLLLRLRAAADSGERDRNTQRCAGDPSSSSSSSSSGSESPGRLTGASRSWEASSTVRKIRRRPP